jgi:hypothetical protein
MLSTYFEAYPMKTFKKILLALAITATSSTAFAVANSSYEEVQSAINNTLAKVEEANTGINSGADTEKLIEMVTDARQLQKDVLDVKRNQASNVLKQARSALQKNELEVAKESLADALNRYKEIKQIYAANHQ